MSSLPPQTTGPRPADSPLSIDDLVAYFRSGAKDRTRFKIGIEQEKIAVRDDGRPVQYEGPRGLAELLAVLESRGFAATREDGHVIALARGGDRITMEPGGQLELSGGALSAAADCAAALDAHVREVAEAARPLGIRFIGTGVRPFGALDDIDWLPKRRYVVMRDYFPRYGRQSRLAPQMMKLTATVQANFDFASEADAAEKIRTAYGVTSIVTALFAASPIAFGRPTGLKSYRAAIWLETDADRCGLLPFVFKPDFRFRDYVEWALDVPMFFVVRDGVYRPAAKMTFRRFLAEGWEGQRATIADWEVHLSTLFPEVRLKRYVEVRGADAGPMPMARGLGALWRGILEDAEARRAAYALVADHTFEEREALRREVPGAGLTARFGRRSLRDLAVELCRIAADGLSRLPGGVGDRALLAPVAAYAEAGRSPADDMLQDFEAARGDPATLVRRWELRA
ncbi:MAG TPA: glutamate-cysteine ligase family protein [Polyangia bacterium]|jgi:glutamate--cysteine ligase|nr:glutamate-cysteine ligase family protein [Polyangia bacterium]